MGYYLIIHETNGNKITSPKIIPNKLDQDWDDIKVKYHIEKFAFGLMRSKNIEKYEIVLK